MDNSQKPISNPVSPVLAQPSQAPAIHKEQEIGPGQPVQQHEMAVRPTEVQPVLRPEVKEAGVAVVNHLPELTLEDKKAGLSLAKESVIVSTEPSGIVQLPMTRVQAKAGAAVSAKESKKWWSVLNLKLLDRFKIK